MQATSSELARLPRSKRSDSGPGPGRPPKQGLWSLKRAVQRLGGRVIDKRTTIGRQLASWRAELISDLGGHEAISTGEKQLVELAVRTKLMLDSIDAWILTQPTLVLHRKRTIIPVVKERTALADQLARFLGQLGLKRRVREAITIDEYLKSKGATPSDVRSGGSSVSNE